MKEPYVESAKIDKKLNELVKKHPISTCPEEWLTVIRTIQSSLSILENATMAEIMKKIGEI